MKISNLIPFIVCLFSLQIFAQEDSSFDPFQYQKELVAECGYTDDDGFYNACKSEKINQYTILRDILEKAKKENRLVVMRMGFKLCGPCKKLAKTLREDTTYNHLKKNGMLVAEINSLAPKFDKNVGFAEVVKLIKSYRIADNSNEALNDERLDQALGSIIQFLLLDPSTGNGIMMSTNVNDHAWGSMMAAQSLLKQGIE